MDSRARSRFIPTPTHIGLLLTIAALAIGGMEQAAGQTAPPGEAVDGLARHDRAELVRSVDGAAADHAVRHALRAPRRARAPAARAEDGQRAWPSRGRRAPTGSMYEFKLRRGLKFHNGDPLTTEDVKFSFERYKGAGAKELQARVAPGGGRRSR